ncbi:MAG: GNAT family N-acetyltransferase [Bacteroidales bacterium]|jgi:GNAT superfamily N-acetyltransferase|nr:GNAT family N-acetyltransferase [Bacteroidales bacterium]MDD4673714.1 GNAT family N-acetyltransferase [Bacteroidales bacterium]MDY0349001.1 GNAT family N-acetyltransferase [Tenuifilaceae bacterium]
MISIKRVSIQELEKLVFSPSYAQWDVIPISRHRAKSYINNPRCATTDVVLYLAYTDSKLVAYRTIMPDTILGNDETIKVGWLSGSWVNPIFRRKGIASKLLDAAYNDWNGNLLFTNYTKESKAVFDKTSLFAKVATLQGARTYIRPCLAKILPQKRRCFKQLKPIWQLTDLILKILNPAPIFAHTIGVKDIGFEYLKEPDNEIISLFESLTKKLSTSRAGTELQWIMKHPWLVSSPLGDRIGDKYFFSSSPKKFEQLIIKVYRASRLVGFMIINSKDGFATTPYIVCNTSDNKTMAKAMLKHANAMGCYRITTYHTAISEEIKRMRPFKWLTISQKRNFYVTQNLQTRLGSDPNFAEGDGDCAFV